MKIIITAILTLGLMGAPTSKWEKKMSKWEKEKFAQELALKYCTNAKTIAANAKMPISQFTNADEMNDVIVAFDTYIHENYHAYNWKINDDPDCRKYYINDNLILKVRKMKVFNSVKINRIMDKQLQKKVFRYDTYIGNRLTSPIHDSQVNGIYGLLEEFAAYYQGSTATIELNRFIYENFGYNEFEPWFDYLTIPTSSYYALYEFQLFISWYLQYARDYEPEIYRQILNNESLKLAYTVIISNFKKEVEQYFLIREIVLAKFQKRFDLRDEYLYVDEDGDGFYESGLGIPDDDIKFLKAELRKPEHQILSKLRLSPSEMQNQLALAK